MPENRICPRCLHSSLPIAAGQKTSLEEKSSHRFALDYRRRPLLRRHAVPQWPGGLLPADARNETSGRTCSGKRSSSHASLSCVARQRGCPKLPVVKQSAACPRKLSVGAVVLRPCGRTQHNTRLKSSPPQAASPCLRIKSFHDVFIRRVKYRQSDNMPWNRNRKSSGRGEDSPQPPTVFTFHQV